MIRSFAIFLILSLLFVPFTHSQKKLPSVYLENLNGETIDVSEISEGEMVIVSFWATWCVPCIQELDEISLIYDDWKKKLGVKLIAIAVDDSRSVKKVKPMAYGKGWKYEILLDQNDKVRRAIGANVIPLTLIVENDRILYRQIGYTRGKEKQLFGKILELKGD